MPTCFQPHPPLRHQLLKGNNQLCTHLFSASSPSATPIMTSASSIPSINACLDSSPHPTLPPIEGLPTYESLSAIKELLKANTASVHTMGSRGNHGYLGLILSAPVYNMITPGTSFVIPNNPGLIPLIMGALQHKLLEHYISTTRTYSNGRSTPTYTMPSKNNWSMPLSPSTYRLIRIDTLALPSSTFMTSYNFYLTPMEGSLQLTYPTTAIVSSYLGTQQHPLK